MSYIGHCMGVKIEKDMREDLFSHLLTAPFSYFDKTKVGQIMSRITTDLFDIAEFSHHCPEELFIAIIKITASFIILSQINLVLTAMIFAFVRHLLKSDMIINLTVLCKIYCFFLSFYINDWHIFPYRVIDRVFSTTFFAIEYRYYPGGMIHHPLVSYLETTTAIVLTYINRMVSYV